MKTSITENQNKKFFFLVLSLTFICYILYTLRTVFTPFIIAFCLSYFIAPIADKLEKCHIQRTLGIILLISFLITIIIILSLLLFPIIKLQTEKTINNIPLYIDIIKSWVRPISDLISKKDTKALESIIENSLKNLGDIPLNLISSSTSYIWKTISNISDFISTCLSLLVIPIAAFYMLRDFDIIKEKVFYYIPSKYKNETMSTFKEINSVLGNFVRGQLTVSIILIVLYGIGLYLCETPMWIVISIVAGLANIVPFMGLIIGLLPAVIITYLHYHDWYQIFSVITVFTIVQLLESTVVTPKIIGKTLGLHPLIIIFAIFLGGSVFGFFGILLAVPAASVINVLVKRWFLWFQKNQTEVNSR